MKLPRASIPLLLLLTATFIGCAPRTRFQVSVVNRTAAPLTVGLVKVGRPFEPHLADPGELAGRSPTAMLPPWGMVIPPGKSADTQVDGEFPPGSELTLRVYHGQHSNLDLISMPDNPYARITIPLYPGPNELIIHDRSGPLGFTRVRPTPR